jgi:hypothetical protein
MSSTYKNIIKDINDLTSAEMVSLLAVIAQRLRDVVGVPDVEDGDEGQEGLRRYLPRLPQMIEWQLVRPTEDKLYVRDMPDKPALLIDGSYVAYNGERMTINDWGKLLTGWKGFNIYEWVIVERTEQTLDEMRHEYMNDHGFE